MVVIGSVPGDVSPAFFFPAIYIIALGTGGIKPNVSTMGADQFDLRYSRDRKEKESFFNWFYWSINLGSMISYTVVAYICQYGLPGLGGQKWGFFVGYTIPAIAMGELSRLPPPPLPWNHPISLLSFFFVRNCYLGFHPGHAEIPDTAAEGNSQSLRSPLFPSSSSDRPRPSFSREVFSPDLLE